LIRLISIDIRNYKDETVVKNGFDYFKLIVQDEYLALKETLFEGRWVLIFIAAIFVAVILLLKPFPPHTVTLTKSLITESAYNRMEQTFKDALEKNGMKTKLVGSTGPIDSANLLENPKDGVNVAFIQGGALSPEQASKFYSLGSIGYEAVWIFYRKDLPRIPQNLKDLIRLNLKIGLGPAEGGSSRMAKNLFQANGIDISTLKNFRNTPVDQEFDDLLNSKIDCVIRVAPYYDHLIQTILRNPKIALMGIEDAKAYQMSLHYLEKLVLPAHSVDIIQGIPEIDIPLIATTTTMAVSKDLNEDVQTLLLVTAHEKLLDSTNLFFAYRGEFPKYMDPSTPISPVARSYYSNGQPPFFNYLPFWLAGFINRLWVFILTGFALAYPLMKLNMKLRTTKYEIKRHPYYDELFALERKLTNSTLSKKEAIFALHQLDKINQRVLAERVPIGMEQSYFDFLNSIQLVKNKILFSNEWRTADNSQI
jgi:TRAP-type uncharacterized transport system substrate-binding protein